MAREDEDALSWDGDDDPTLVAPEPAGTGGSGGKPMTAGASIRESGTNAATADPGLPKGWHAIGNSGARATAAGSDTVDDEIADVPEARGAEEAHERPGLSNAALIGFGIVGGAFVLYAIGWLIAGLRLLDGLDLVNAAQPLVAPIAFQVTLWLTVLAPPIWFGVVLFLTRSSKQWIRFLWLAAGVVLLVPWPFIMVGAIG